MLNHTALPMNPGPHVPILLGFFFGGGRGVNAAPPPKKKDLAKKGKPFTIKALTKKAPKMTPKPTLFGHLFRRFIWASILSDFC